MMLPTDFLLARAAEDEATARGDVDHFGGTDDPRDQWIVHHATRVLLECEAKRQIVAAALADDNRDLYGGCGDDCEWKALDYAVACLALPYVDHPDYREEWRP
jgi:hypothetical protein